MKPIKFNDLSAQWATIEEAVIPKVQKFLRDGQYIGGEHVESFENAFAKYTGSRYAIGTSNGSDGLKLAIEALDLYGSVNVILPANGFMADVFAAKYQVNAKYHITFIDNDRYYQMDAGKLEAHLFTPNSYDHVIIIPVHLYGHPSNMSFITQLAKRHNCYVIEDASQAQGAMCDGKMVGSWGDMTVYSLYPGKNLGACGDAGVITTNKEKYKDRLLMLRNYGSPKKYYHDIDGWNHRLDPLQAIILEEKLKYLDNWNHHRHIVHDMYQLSLKYMGYDVVLPQTAEYATRNVHHIFPILAKDRDGLMEYLETKGITTIIHYPIALERCACNKGMQIEYKNTNALKNADRLLSLPIHPFLDYEQTSFICETIKSFYRR